MGKFRIPTKSLRIIDAPRTPHISPVSKRQVVDSEISKRPVIDSEVSKRPVVDSEVSKPSVADCEVSKQPNGHGEASRRRVVDRGTQTGDGEYPFNDFELIVFISKDLECLLLRYPQKGKATHGLLDIATKVQGYCLMPDKILDYIRDINTARVQLLHVKGCDVLVDREDLILKHKVVRQFLLQPLGTSAVPTTHHTRTVPNVVKRPKPGTWRILRGCERLFSTAVVLYGIFAVWLAVCVALH